MRWLWLGRTDPSHGWLVMPLREDPTTTAFFNNSIMLHLADGKLFTFWIGPWLDGTTLVSVYPELAAMVPARLRREHKVASALNNNAWIKDVRGALTIPVLAQFIELHHRLSVVVLRHGVQDTVTWHWFSSGCFSMASAYRALFTGQIAVLGAKELWKS
jgi:hypothetical protein